MVQTLWDITSVILIIGWAAALPLGLFGWIAALRKKFPLAQQVIRLAVWGLLFGALSIVGSCVESFAEVAQAQRELRSGLTGRMISLAMYKVFLLVIPALVAFSARDFIKKRFENLP